MVLYSTSICNRSLYSTLLCKVFGFFMFQACSHQPRVVKCPEVMDVKGHVVCFRQLQLWVGLFPVLPVFRSNSISGRIFSVGVLIKFSFSKWCSDVELSAIKKHTDTFCDGLTRACFCFMMSCLFLSIEACIWYLQLLCSLYVEATVTSIFPLAGALAINVSTSRWR